MTPTATPTLNYTTQQLTDIIQQAKEAAHKAALTYFNDVLDNVDRGMCGFAWVEIRGVKGNTKLGKALKAAGVTQDWQRVFHIWNPANVGAQSLNTKEVGAQAAADVLRSYGFTAHACSRLD